MIARGMIASLALTLIFATSAGAQLRRPGLASQDPASQNELIERRVLPPLEHLFQKLVAEKRDSPRR